MFRKQAGRQSGAGGSVGSRRTLTTDAKPLQQQQIKKTVKKRGGSSTLCCSTKFSSLAAGNQQIMSLQR